MSSAILAAPPADRPRVEWSQSWIRLKQPEDYTVPRRVHGEANSSQRKGSVLETKIVESTIASLWQGRLRYFEERQDQIVETIRELVQLESPSDNKQAVDESPRSSLTDSKRSAGGPNSIAAPISATVCRSTSAGKALDNRNRSRFCCWDITTRFIRWERWRVCRAKSKADGYSDPAFST